jgi:uncharacterized protein (DUF934 family)
MPLFRDGHFVDDDWTILSDDAEIPAHGRVALPKARYLAERAALAGRNEPVGLVLRSGETLAGVEDDLEKIGLIVLDIPKYSDGRLYSIARLARERHGFTGELRASGDVLRDQIAHLHRAGVTAFDVTHEGTIAALRDGAIVAVREHYQSASRDGEEKHVGWRPRTRLSPAGAIPGTKS